MLKKVGSYLIQHRHYAIALAFMAALLPFLGFATAWISILIIAFVTLVKGGKEGLIIVLWVALPALALFIDGDISVLMDMVVFRVVVVWLLALLLRHKASWTLTLQSCVVLSVLVIAGLHYYNPNIAGWWAAQLTRYWLNMSSQLNLSPNTDYLALIQRLAGVATGVLTVLMLSVDLCILLMARAWQAALYKPGGLRQELQQLRMGWGQSVLLLSCTFAASMGSALALDILPVILMPFVLAALSLIHVKLASKKTVKLPLLTGMYLTFLLLMPYTIIPLAIIGVVDSWCDFRHLNTKAKVEMM
ncbi:MAG: hypothetical protein QM752_01700 [Gammaproteobacteria bacterium]